MSDQPPKALKLTVISMGVMILGGFLWVGAVVASRAGEQAAKPRSKAKALVECQQISLPAPPNAKLEFANGEWLVIGKTQVRRYTQCGELLQITTLTGDM